MRYFLDAEFNGFGGELISIAVVPERPHAPHFYEAIICEEPVPWVQRHVLPKLRTEPRQRAAVAIDFAGYLSVDPEPEIVADWPDDIAHAAALMSDGHGRRHVLSSVRFRLLAPSGFAADSRSAVAHNAYHDAVALRQWCIEKGCV